jgi:hypothetical protein
MCQKCESAHAAGQTVIASLAKAGRLKDERNPKERVLCDKLVLAMIRIYALQDKIQGGANVFEHLSEAPMSFWIYLEKHLEEALEFVKEAKVAAEMPDKAVTH